jgi:hypothetical protein
MPIEYPLRNEGRATLRRLIKMVAQSHPVPGALAHLYRLHSPEPI